MRRIWIGAGVLLALLLIGILMMKITDRQLGSVSETLKQASAAKSWSDAVSLAEQAQKEWKKQWHLVASLADHTDMDAIDEAFAKLEVYQRYQEKLHHAATCAQLSEAIRGLEKNHRFSWWNLL